MKIAETIRDVREHIRRARSAGKSIALIPTMGAMHEGHFSLIDAAGTACDFLVVSIFVNPTQFGPSEDYRAYPRTREADLSACERFGGVDLVFIPGVEEMYPSGAAATEVTVAGLTRTLCGRSRPGHFAGVCTVVAKLFNIVQPDKAFFGAKDFQQAAVIRRMAAEMNFPIDIVICPTVREADGLAMSTRNAYLKPAQRKQAAALYESLRLAERMIRRSHPPVGEVIAAVRERLTGAAPDGVVDYIEIVDPQDLRNVQDTEAPVLVALAVSFDEARLIDNILVDAGPEYP